MDSNEYIGFMALQSHPIVEGLARKLDIPKRDALDFFYTSRFYKLYEREDTKLWHFSNLTLTDLLHQEITEGHIDFPVEG